MSAMPRDAVFEDLVRTVMREGLPSDGLPIAVREKIDTVPDHLPRRMRRPTEFLQPILRLAATAVLSIGLVGVVVILGSTYVGNSGVGSPAVLPSAPFDPSDDGVGIVRNPERTLRELPWLVASVVAAAALLLVVGRSVRLKAAGASVSLAAFVAAFFVATQPGVGFWNAWGPLFNIEVEQAPSVTDGPDAFHVVAAPGQNFGVLFNVENEGSLPITVLGVVEPSPTDPNYSFTWTAVGMEPNFTGRVGPLDEAVPFTPVELTPGGALNIYLIGRAGPCAAGVSSRGLTGTSQDSVEIAFSVLGLPASDEVKLPFVVAEENRAGCPPG